MDTTKFKPRMFLDSGVFIRALEHDNPKHADDPRIKDCRDLWVALLRAPKSKVYISAISLFEFLRGPGTVAPPPLPNVIYASYDYKTALDMQRWATTAALVEVKRANGETSRIVTYDALIVGTAAAKRTDIIVTLDAGVHALAAKAGVQSKEPSYFRVDPLLFGRAPPEVDF